MLKRFSLYGFLKNQKYFEDWILLAFLAKGISYTDWGLLIGFRELMINVMEIPSGAIADLFGRRKSMILSFVAYIVSFVIFGTVKSMPMLFVGMAFFAVGEAFRTGTHKAMIFTWLRLEGRTDEKTKTYGYTRSWSKFGSALCVVISGVIVFTTRNYDYIFLFAIIPYVLGIINFLGYPKELEGDIKPGGRVTISETATHLKEALLLTIRKADLRRLIFETMGFGGILKGVKDYLGPILKIAAVAWLAKFAFAEGLVEEQKTALLVAPVGFGLYLLAAVASRNAYRLVRTPSGEDRAARMLWALYAATFVALIPALLYGQLALVIVAFVVLSVLQNLWRPVLISRVDDHCPHSQKATILSVESQAKSVSTMIVAPLLGAAIDYLRAGADPPPVDSYYPLAVLGAVVGICFFVTARVTSQTGGGACPPLPPGEGRGEGAR